MDYKKLYFLFCDEQDKRNEFSLLKTLSDNVADSIFFYNPDEKYKDLPFTVICGAHYEVGDKHFTKRDSVDNYQIIITSGGRGIVTVEDQKFHCIKDTVMIIDCNKPHEYSVVEGESWDYQHIHFSVATGGKIIADEAVGFCIYCENEMKMCLNGIFSEIRHLRSFSSFLLSNFVSQILTRMIVCKKTNPVKIEQFAPIQRVAQYLQNNYSEKISINQLAEQEYMSVYHLTRQFKEYYSVPPYDYLIKYRLDRAKVLLCQDLSVKEIANLCGFTSVNNFSRNFKNRIGMTPQEFKNQYM